MSTFGGQTKRPEQWGKQWCQYCKMFVQNSKIAQKQHEQSDKHQFAMKRFVKSIYKKTDQQKRQDDMTQRELERIERTVTGEKKPGNSKSHQKRQQDSNSVGPSEEEAAQLQNFLADESTKIGEWQAVVAAPKAEDDSGTTVVGAGMESGVNAIKRPRNDIGDFMIEERKYPTTAATSSSLMDQPVDDPMGILGSNSADKQPNPSSTAATSSLNSLFKRKKKRAKFEDDAG